MDRDNSSIARDKLPEDHPRVDKVGGGERMKGPRITRHLDGKKRPEAEDSISAEAGRIGLRS